MSMSRALKFYQELSEDQKKFIDEKQISATFSIKKWQAFLSKAAAYDTYGDKAIDGLAKKFALYLVLAIVSIIVAFMVDLLIFIASAVFITLFVRQIMIKNKFEKRDMNNYLRLFFFPLLDVLKLKAGEDAKLSAQLDFRIPTRDQKPKEYSVDKKKIREFSQNYIIAKCQLKDAVLLEFVVADGIKEMKYWKRSASGKQKHKSKTKVTHQYYVKITAPKSEYSLKGKIPEMVRFEETDTDFVFKLKTKAKIDNKSHVLPVKEFLANIQQIYELIRANDPEKWEIKEKKPEGVGVEAEREEYYDDYTGVSMMMWSGGYFDRYDYESFESSETGIYDDASDEDTFFDS